MEELRSGDTSVRRIIRKRIRQGYIRKLQFQTLQNKKRENEANLAWTTKFCSPGTEIHSTEQAA